MQDQPLPDVSTAEDWLAAQGVGGELLGHVRLVAAIAEHLARRLVAKGERVDPILAQRGGLLHDLAKVSAKQAGRSHEQMGAELLRDRGQLALSEITLRHAVWAPSTDDQRPETWEQKLVYYADRIAKGPQLVTIEERIADMWGRRPELRDRLPEYKQAALAQEAEIAAALGLTREELRRELEREVGPAAS